MAPNDPAHTLHQLVVRGFLDLGAPEDSASSFAERILIRDGCYYGHQFFCDEIRALWVLESGIIRFFDPAGRLLKTVHVDEPSSDQARAA